jgi:hypothetical protein
MCFDKREFFQTPSATSLEGCGILRLRDRRDFKKKSRRGESERFPENLDEEKRG